MSFFKNCALLSVLLASVILLVHGMLDESDHENLRAMEAGCYSMYSDDFEGKQAINKSKHLWSKGIVPYALDPTSNWTASETMILQQGMQKISSKTCITFRARTNEANYVSFTTTNATGCNSPLGMQGNKQKVNLKRSGCINEGTVAHELIHALGIDHEQTRTDRDTYVNIFWDNIEDGHSHNFDVRNGSTTFDLAYDYNSIMHYLAYAFAKNKTMRTMGSKSKDADKQVPEKYPKIRDLTTLDVKKIKLLYNCQ